MALWRATYPTAMGMGPHAWRCCAWLRLGLFCLLIVSGGSDDSCEGAAGREWSDHELVAVVHTPKVRPRP